MRWEQARLFCELQSQTTIDDPKRNDTAAEPDMCVRPEHSFRVLLETEVVDKAQERLDEKDSQQDESDDGMSAIHHPSMCGHPDAYPCGSDIDEVAEELEEAMDEP